MIRLKLTLLLARIGSLLTLVLALAGYGLWVWRRVKKLDAAGVEPPPAPPAPPPGPLPPASPPPW